jgi:5-methylcytosine-specific restriction endonuclease McrA
VLLLMPREITQMPFHCHDCREEIGEMSPTSVVDGFIFHRDCAPPMGEEVLPHVHVTPIDGGETSYDNCRISHPDCNVQKESARKRASRVALSA